MANDSVVAGGLGQLMRSLASVAERDGDEALDAFLRSALAHLVAIMVAKLGRDACRQLLADALAEVDRL
jgi:hypothetical protein